MESPSSTRRKILRSTAAWSVLTFAATGSRSARAGANYPERALRLLVAFPPGGATDLIARELGKGLTEIWGQPVVVDNKPGAAGLIAADTVAKATPDGYTLMLATDGAIVAVPFLVANTPYDSVTDFSPVSLVAGIPLMLVANPNLGVKTFNEFIALAKSKPGRIDYASSGVGASHYMSMELLQRVAGISLNHIPYKGGAPALQDVLAGRVPVMFSAISTSIPYIRAGKLVPLATGSLERSPLLPDLPTVAELGYPGFEAGNWVGILAPKNTPPELVATIRSGLEKVVHTKSYRDTVQAQGNEVRSSTTADFKERIKREYARNREMIKAAGVEPT
jgi:tripartite-type tricarboxylate transporter receptor subunit TctC